MKVEVAVLVSPVPDKPYGFCKCYITVGSFVYHDQLLLDVCFFFFKCSRDQLNQPLQSASLFLRVDFFIFFFYMF